MRELIRELCALPGVTGHEDAVRERIRVYAAPFADEIREDALGNLLVLRKGTLENAPTVMLCAHMDEVGLLVRAITDEGYIRFVCAGGIDRRVLIGRRVFIGTRKLPGVVGVRAVHLSDPDERKKIPKLEDMYIDAGFESKERAQEIVELGDYITFDARQTELGDGFFRSKALDDRVGCAALLKVMEERYKYDVWYVFSVQEEIGMRGAFGAAFAIKPDAALVVEGTTAADIPSLPAHRRVCAPGAGVVIPFMDGGTIYDRNLFEKLRSCADKHGFSWQTKEYVAGGTDAAAIQRTRTGCATAALSVAVRYLHSPVSTVKWSDCEMLPAVVCEFLRGMIVNV